jgi:hypothetical protein
MAFTIDPEEEGQIVTIGWWKSQLLENNILNFPAGTDSSWGTIYYKIENVDSDNYVVVEVLSSGGSVILSFTHTSDGTFSQDISSVGTQNIYIKVTIYQYQNSVIVSKLELLPFTLK